MATAVLQKQTGQTYPLAPAVLHGARESLALGALVGLVLCTNGFCTGVETWGQCAPDRLKSEPMARASEGSRAREARPSSTTSSTSSSFLTSPIFCARALRPARKPMLPDPVSWPGSPLRSTGSHQVQVWGPIYF